MRTRRFAVATARRFTGMISPEPQCQSAVGQSLRSRNRQRIPGTLRRRIPQVRASRAVLRSAQLWCEADAARLRPGSRAACLGASVMASRRLQFATRFCERHWRQPPRRSGFGTRDRPHSLHQGRWADRARGRDTTTPARVPRRRRDNATGYKPQQNRIRQPRPRVRSRRRPTKWFMTSPGSFRTRRAL